MMRQLQKQEILTIAGGTDHISSDNHQEITNRCSLYQKKIDDIHQEIGNFIGLHTHGSATQNMHLINHASSMKQTKMEELDSAQAEFDQYCQ